MSALVGDSLSAPPPGSTAIGDLYIDLQTRTMWMGVDSAVDPTGAVLLSDIMSIQPSINASLQMANQYTDTKLTGYSLIGHTHVAADVTDFDTAVEAAIANNPAGGGFFKGFIAMYSGPVSDIGINALAGWVLCDGSNGTPNLVDRFIMGAGLRSPGFVNTAKDIRTDTIAAHTHVIGSTVLTIANLPSHTHSVTASGSGSGSAAYAGDHAHTVRVYGGDGGRAEGPGSNGTPGVLGDFWTSTNGAHTHTVSVSVNVSGTAAATGSGTGHTHTAAIGGAHDHVLKMADLRDSMPYMILAFIMKL